MRALLHPRHMAPETSPSLCVRFVSSFFKSEVANSRPIFSYPRTHHPSNLSLAGESLSVEVNHTHYSEGGAPTKRPRLLGDMQLDGPSSASFVSSGSVPLVGSAAGEASLSISSPPRVSQPSQETLITTF